MPTAAAAVWQAIRWFLPAATAAKVMLLSGPANRTAPAPTALREFVGYEAIREDARARHASLQGGGEAGAPVSDGSRKRE